jgi:hypothetical protein
MALMMRFGVCELEGHAGERSRAFNAPGVQRATLETEEWKGVRNIKVMASALSDINRVGGGGQRKRPNISLVALGDKDTQAKKVETKQKGNARLLRKRVKF